MTNNRKKLLLLNRGGGFKNVNNFDEDYFNVLSTAYSLKYSLPSTSQQAIQNQLVLDLKSNGIWDEEKVLYVPATDGDINFASLNLKDPTIYPLNRYGGITFIPNSGFNFNGVDAYADVGASIYDLGLGTEDLSVSIHVDDYITSIGGTAAFYGSGFEQPTVNTTGKVTLYYTRTITRIYAKSNSSGYSYANIAENLLGGFYQTNNVGSLIKCYKDGSTLTSSSPVHLGADDLSIFLGAFNNSGSIGVPANFTSGVFSVGTSQDSKAVIKNTLFSNYITSINA